MCHPLSLCVMRDQTSRSAVLGMPGVHSHSELLALWPEYRTAGGGIPEYVPVEVNLLERVVVLDADRLPEWYDLPHDRALKAWVQERLGGRDTYRDGWAPTELGMQAYKRPRGVTDRGLVLAPFGPDAEKADLATLAIDEARSIGGNRIGPKALVGKGKDCHVLVAKVFEGVARRLAEGDWADAWQDEEPWRFTLDRDYMAPGRRLHGAESYLTPAATIQDHLGAVKTPPGSYTAVVLGAP